MPTTFSSSFIPETYALAERGQSRLTLPFRILALTDIIRVEVLAEIGEARPGENEKVNLRNESALFMTSLKAVPDYSPDPPAQGLFLHGGFHIA